MIAIKDMEMPKSYKECQCQIDAYGGWWCGIKQFSVSQFIKERHPNCPLREVK